jgi:hypothetical protein
VCVCVFVCVCARVRVLPRSLCVFKMKKNLSTWEYFSKHRQIQLLTYWIVRAHTCACVRRALLTSEERERNSTREREKERERIKPAIKQSTLNLNLNLDLNPLGARCTHTHTHKGLSTTSTRYVTQHTHTHYTNTHITHTTCNTQNTPRYPHTAYTHTQHTKTQHTYKPASHPHLLDQTARSCPRPRWETAVPAHWGIFHFWGHISGWWCSAYGSRSEDFRM